ncbi:MAG: UDP-N-acetylglucosamine 1-carboxyvinyltransferase [Candidatus Doudnabacteria bacterium]|nr:UDP-N-acetylglucosamine 1-carboxyvinyltransferase [Candidatus Doudnabacteria bacterium]
MSETKKIGQFISELRQERGLTQGELAQALKTTQSAVARMEKGQQNFSTEMLSKISKVLNKEIITLAGQSVNFKVEGGHKLKGRIVTNTSKNAALGLLCASLLNRGVTTLKNVPKIEEVFRILEVINSIGVKTEWKNSDLVIVPPKKFSIEGLNYEAAIKTRSVIMLMGPLIHFVKKFSLPFAGGCKLGERTVAPHLFALESLGVEIKTVHDHYDVEAKKLKPAEIVLYEMGDTVTENALMAAALVPGKTTIKYASANYMVQDMCLFLEHMGVKIEGVGTTTLMVWGKEKIDEDVEFSVMEDPIESMMFLSLAAVTNSSIVIERCPIDFLELELYKMRKMGFKYKIIKSYKSGNAHTNLADIQTFESSLVALGEKIHPLPSNSGINIDNLPFFVPIAAKAKGKTLIHDWVYENRAIYYLELNKLRANISLADAHRVYVEGPTKFKAAEVICPPALRPAVIILITMLAAEGTSILRNVYSIARGYEDLASRLKSLGAKIEVLKGI